MTNHVQWFRLCHITDFGPFGSFRILSDHAAFTRSCRVAWNAALKPLSWGSFTTASPLKWWISWGKSGRTSMKDRVKSWGRVMKNMGNLKHLETNWKTWGKKLGKQQMCVPWFSLFCANTVSCCRAPREHTGMTHFQYCRYPIHLNSQRSWCGAPGRIWQTLRESTWQLPEKLQADPSWCSTMDHKVRKRRGNEKTWADLFDEF